MAHVGEELTLGHVGGLGGFLRGFQLALRPLAVGNVAGDLGGPDDPAVAVPYRGNGQGNVEPFPIFGHPHRLHMLHALAVPYARENLLFLLDSFRRQQERDRSANDLLRPVAEEAAVPRRSRSG